MSARSLSAKMASFAAKSAAKSSVSSVSGAEYSMLDMVLMGAGVVVIILLLVYIYNRFIHKQPAKNEYFVSMSSNSRCNCGKKVEGGNVSCVNCTHGVNREDGTCLHTDPEY